MKMIQEFSFAVGSSVFTATLWSKVPGKERYYIKNAAGAEFAVQHMENGEINRAKLKAWPSAEYRAQFKEAFEAGMIEARKDAQAIEDMERINAMQSDAPAPVAAVSADEIEICTGDEYRKPGSLLRNPKERAQILAVISIKNHPYFDDDDDCTKASYYAKCRTANEAESAAFIEAETAENQARDARVARDEKVAKAWYGDERSK